MNDTSKQLVDAVEAALDADAKPLAGIAVAATLRKLSDLMVEGGWEDGNEWPDPDDLHLLADDIEGGGE